MFPYNRNIHSSTCFLPFEIMYGFIPLTPLDFTLLPLHKITNLDGQKKPELVKTIHEKARQHLKKEI